MQAKYTGKVPCPGCGRTGEEHARDSKDGLCRDCQAELEIGRALCKERDLKRNWYKMDELCGGRLTFHSIHNSELHARLKTLLGTFSEFQLANVGKWFDISRSEATSGKDLFVLPEKTADAAKELTESLYKIAWELDEDKRTCQEKLKKEAAAELAEQKNQIYNEGIAYGRNLLMQLNNNEISADEFTRPVKRF